MTYPYVVLPERRSVSMPVARELERSSQFLSFSMMEGSEFWTYEPFSTHTMLPRMLRFAALMLKPVIP